MAFEQLFVRSKKLIGGIQLDAVVSENHTNEVRLTSNPIELGADITDNAINEPKVVNVIAVVSDTPLGIAALGEIVDNITGLFGTATSNNITRSSAAYNSMVLLQELREPIELQTKLKLYTNMVITKLTVGQDKNSSKIVLMNMTLKEAIITESELIDLTADQLEAGTTTKQASPANNRGRQETTTPDTVKETSILKTVLDWVGE